jgi:hypothetical protein
LFGPGAARESHDGGKRSRCVLVVVIDFCVVGRGVGGANLARAGSHTDGHVILASSK